MNKDSSEKLDRQSKMSQPIVPQSLKPIEILAIDDDEWFLRLLIKKFEDVDPTFLIKPVSSVDDAIVALKEKVYDAISELGMIEKGEAVKVIKVEATQVYVGKV